VHDLVKTLTTHIEERTSNVIVLTPLVKFNMNEKTSGNTSIIAYVHNLSPTKQNRKNTVDYATLTLQKSTDATQEAFFIPKTRDQY